MLQGTDTHCRREKEVIQGSTSNSRSTLETIDTRHQRRMMSDDDDDDERMNFNVA